jgi:hypothetical protein
MYITIANSWWTIARAQAKRFVGNYVESNNTSRICLFSKKNPHIQLSWSIRRSLWSLILEKNKRREASISELDKIRKEFKLSLTDQLEPQDDQWDDKERET